MKPDLTLDEVRSPGQDDGALLDLMAKVHLTLGSIESELKAQRDHRERLIRAIHPFKSGPFPVPVTAGAGGLIRGDDLGPHGGYAWDIHQVIASGFTAGTVTMYSGNPPLIAIQAGAGSVEFSFSAAGQLTYGKGQLLLMPGDALAFWASGITGTPQILIHGTEMEVGLVAEYLI